MNARRLFWGRFQDGAKMENFHFRLFEMATKKFSAREQKAPVRVGWFGAGTLEIWCIKNSRLFTRLFFLARLFFSAGGKCITVAENFCLGKKRELEQPKTNGNFPFSLHLESALSPGLALPSIDRVSFCRAISSHQTPLFHSHQCSVLVYFFHLLPLQLCIKHSLLIKRGQYLSS